LFGLHVLKCYRLYSSAGRTLVIRISLQYIFTLAAEIEPLSQLPDGPVPFTNVLFRFFVAENSIRSLSHGSLFSSYLRISYPLSQQLLSALHEQTSKEDFNRNIEQFEMWNIKNLYSQYRIALLAELGAFNSYFVAQKGGFDMFSLLFSGEMLYPQDLLTKVPEALTDAREAAKALAFDVPTACGFHTFRVVESVLRRYYSVVTDGRTHPKVRNIGVYVNALRQARRGDEKILSAIKQMADLHRNPLIHPEVILTAEEAIATTGIARSVVTAMLDALPTVPATTTSPASVP
jgi:hypothetical protein